MLPSEAGIDGMMNTKTMIAPWSVKALLYVSESMKFLPAVKSSVRTATASSPPTRKNASTDTRYMTPMRLWSTVVSQLMIPGSAVR